ncbi:DUF6103 family protein [Lacrimispora saccharolytica]|uniref:Uncharacterized protein n=1 Tax=Lacrimispora saccharolytica (strain ATCC 35040 / DSM 2544 / NRCC 2533 / WM1) TaxID=610130 RepID=D9R6D9_LACSW|nr:DUF6103 family protein [Lacrimispora saccharolytica]ADL05349.1 conserved hypothetical protein [[Clostridium] saccharolyticum WM1]QRV20483.1 hypothetical protein I6K70_02755 [Lacrimispora saccharolytica]
MKKDTIVISLEAEKLRAIKKYMDKKEADLQAEMADQLQKLYEKYVPANVREYIDEREDEEIKPEKPKKPTKVTTDSRSHSSAQDGQE